MENLNPGSIRDGVLGGLNNYLFLFDGGHHQFAYLVGDRVPIAASVSNFYKNIYQRNRYCKERGIPYRHLVFPSKPVLATNKLPDAWRERVKSLFLNSYAPATNWPEYLQYPLELLRAKDIQRPVFQELDTHLTDYGSLVVALNLLKSLGLSYVSTEYFLEKDAQLSGDLARMLKSSATVPGTIIRPRDSIILLDNRKNLPSNGGNITIIYNPNPGVPKKRLLIFGDSFIKEALIFFTPLFRDILYVRSPLFQPDLIELFGPDVVITSNAERYLSRVSADQDSSPLLMDLCGMSSYTPPADFHKALTAQLAWRHHPSSYHRWRKKILVEIAPLGSCTLNSQIEVIDADQGIFMSLGSDPHITFNCTPLRAGQRYLLRIRIHSDVASNATIYYQNLEISRFSENLTVRQPVNFGANELRFLLDSGNLGASLRFDPLACPGRFTIREIMLTEQ